MQSVPEKYYATVEDVEDEYDCARGNKKNNDMESAADNASESNLRLIMIFRAPYSLVLVIILYHLGMIVILRTLLARIRPRSARSLSSPLASPSTEASTLQLGPIFKSQTHLHSLPRGDTDC